MIPVSDSIRSRRTPYVNVAFIAINVLVFFYELTLSNIHLSFFALTELEQFYFDWGSIPACLGDQLGFGPSADSGALQARCPDAGQTLLTPLTSMFIHGGWLHLIGNMIFLWVFGDNVEDAMGHVRYAFFYIAVGIAATVAHIAVNQSDLIPAIGASGAIAGILGAYVVLYPRANVRAILPILIFIWIPIRMPAMVLIGLWFLLQLFNGFAALSATDVVGAGGVAWFAHIGGFVAGLLLVKLFVAGRPPPRSISRRRQRAW